MQNRYTAIFVRDGDWWLAKAAEVPGAATQGKTRAEARENLREAVQLMVECQREDAEQWLAEEGLLDQADYEELAIDIGEGMPVPAAAKGGADEAA